MSIQSSVKLAVFGASGVLGVQAAMRRMHRRRLMVLCYHGVVANEHAADRHTYRNAVAAAEFDRQMTVLRRAYQPVSAEQVIAWTTGESLPNRAVLVTFDDGYRNNLTHALPILARHEIPALVSITTDYIGSARLLWPTEVEVRLRHGSNGEIPAPDRDEPLVVPPPGPARVAVVDEVRRACKQMDATRLAEYLERLRSATELPAGEIDAELTAFLDWDEVRALQRGGVTIASHTVSHPILTRISAEDLHRELEESKRRIESELGTECPCLVYPNGGAEDYSPDVEAAVAAAGYRVAFRLTNGLNPERIERRFAIDRVDVPGHAPRSAFDVRVCGMYSRFI